MPVIPALPKTSAYSDQPKAADTPIEIRVSMPTPPCRAEFQAARWNGSAPHTATGVVRIRASHCQLSNCSAGIIVSNSTGRARTAQTKSRVRS